MAHPFGSRPDPPFPRVVTGEPDIRMSVNPQNHRPITSKTEIRVCAKTSTGQEAYLEQNDPRPDPLPSDGRGNSQPRLSLFPRRLDTPTDGARFSLSHP